MELRSSSLTRRGNHHCRCCHRRYLQTFNMLNTAQSICTTNQTRPTFGYRNHWVAVQLEIQIVEPLRPCAVHLIDAFADARLLIEHRAIQAQKLDVHRLVQLTDRADMEHLARRLQVGIVAANHLSGACEIRFGQIVKVQILGEGWFLICCC